jgi:SurA N-terminal domain
VRTLALAGLCTALLAGCGGSGGDRAVAHVGGEPITQKQLDDVVDHFRAETEHEGSSYPKEGTSEFERLRNQLLGLLVYRVELRQAARRLGVEADPNKITKRLAAAESGGEEEGGSPGDTFARDSVEAQLLIEGIYAKVTRGVTGATATETIARTNHRWTAFLKRLRKQTEVRYEPGYGPGS